MKSEFKETGEMKIKVAQRIDQVQEYYFATKLRQIEQLNQEGKKVINLGIGSPDLPPHPEVISTLHEEALKPGNHGYQNYKGHVSLRNAAAAWYQKYYGVSLNADSEILPLIGSKEGIMHICMTYINPGDRVLIPDPGYPTYKSAASIAGANVIPYHLKKENEWFPDFEELDRLAEQPVKVMFVNYPQMPTGKLPNEQFFGKLVAFAKKNNILICHDNPYSFILNNHPLSMLSTDGARDVVIELNSLSKSHNMAGWRVGFVLADEKRISEIMRFKSNMDSGMFLPLQLAAAKALSLGDAWYDQLNEVYRRRREGIYRLLDKLKAKYEKNQAGLFVWAEVSEQYVSGYELSDRILESSNVFITPGGIFGEAGNNYIRLSLCVSENKIDEAIDRIEKNSSKQ